MAKERQEEKAEVLKGHGTSPLSDKCPQDAHYKGKP